MAYPTKLDRQRVLDAALLLLESDGYRALSLRTLAGMLGVSAPSLYRYFPDKITLERELVGLGSKQLLERLMHIATDSDRADDRFRRSAGVYLDFARKSPHLYELMMFRRLANTERTENEKALWMQVLSIVGALSGDPDDTANAVAFWSFLHGYASLEASGKFGSSGPKGGFEAGLNAFVSGFRPA